MSAEGLIGFKLQGITNHPGRTQDLEDIRALFRANQATLDMEGFVAIFASSTGNRCSMNSFAKSAESPLAAEGELAPRPGVEEDPYRTLDDLMSVVEVLCPVWPSRAVFRPGGAMLL